MNKLFRRLNAILCVVILLFSSNILCLGQEGETESAVQKEFIYPKGPEVTAGAAILMDADTGAILYEKDAYSNYYPASITKIMTCLLAIENLSLEQEITYTNEVFDNLPWDAALLGVQRGETLTVKDCLYGLMLRSGNEVAVALAMAISGSEDEFGKLMTERAKEMGALSTVFTNASGLYEDTHYTTAYDMAMITKTAIKNGTFCDVWGAETYEMSATNMSDAYTINNRHYMLLSSRAEYYQYAQGGKTGYEDLAKRTLVTHAKKDDMSLICVVLFDETEDVYVDTENLLDYGFTNFRKARIIDEENRFGKEDGFVSLTDTDYVTLPKEMLVSDLEYVVDYNEDNSNGKIATITYDMSGHYLGTCSLAFVEMVEDDDGVVTPVKKQNKDEEKLYIDIKFIMAIIIVLLILLVIVIYLVKTKEARKIKRNRKKLFKEASRKYKIKKKRRR